MGTLVPQKWLPTDPVHGLEQDVCREYLAYVPDALVGRQFTFTGPCAALAADAETAIRTLQADSPLRGCDEGFAALLLTAEARASSKIEGVDVSGQRLLRAHAARAFEQEVTLDQAAREVLANVDAMDTAMLSADQDAPVTVETILRMHEEVLRVTDLKEFAGKLRACPVWIGGRATSPCEALFVPPPAEDVPRLLEDLAEFCNDTSLPTVAQAAIAHAQFETIHPFVDGNGRTGRALVHLLLRRRGVARRCCPPVSIVLSAIRKDYIGGLDAYHHSDSAGTAGAATSDDAWVRFFARACIDSVAVARAFDDTLGSIQEAWRRQLAPVRRNSSVDLLLGALAHSPILSVSDAAGILGRSFTAANSAIEELESAGVLQQITTGRRNRAFEATDVVEAFAGIEHHKVAPSPA